MNITTLSEVVSKLVYKLHKEGFLTSVLTNKKLVAREYRRNRLLVDIKDNEIRGFLHFRRRNKDNVVVIYEIGVHPDCRRMGVGVGLLNKLTEEEDCINLEAKCSLRNSAAISFWLSSGFVPIKLERRWNKGKKRYSDFVIFRTDVFGGII